MSTTSKSPRWVLRVAYHAARRALPPYGHRFSPKKFTQPQLLACLALKEFQCLDYRGLAAFLADLPEPFGHLGGALFGGFRRDQGKFFAAVTRKEGVAAQGRADRGAQLAQRVVAGQVAKPVVDRLEVVDVEQDQRQRPAVPARAGQLA